MFKNSAQNAVSFSSKVQDFHSIFAVLLNLIHSQIRLLVNVIKVMLTVVKETHTDTHSNGDTRQHLIAFRYRLLQQLFTKVNDLVWFHIGKQNDKFIPTNSSDLRRFSGWFS